MFFSPLHPYNLSSRALTSASYRAYAAYIAGICINVVGFAGVAGQTVPLSATRIYEMSWFTGFGVSALVYYTLSRVFPPRGIQVGKRFEEIDESGMEDEIQAYDYGKQKAVRRRSVSSSESVGGKGDKDMDGVVASVEPL